MTRVYVVDDDPVVCRLAQHILERSGYAVTLFDNALDVLAALDHSLPDLIVTDIMMPRMDGVTLVQRVREKWAALPIIILTARGDATARRRAVEAGASHFLTKPFSSAQLLEGVRRFAAPEDHAPPA